MTRSRAYRFTVEDRNDPRVLELKNFIRSQNVANPGMVPRRVKLQGRLGENNPHAETYRAKYRRGYRRAYQTIRLDHASRFDVYVYVV
jgi:hypothetical protein